MSPESLSLDSLSYNKAPRVGQLFIKLLCPRDSLKLRKNHLCASFRLSSGQRSVCTTSTLTGRHLLVLSGKKIQGESTRELSLSYSICTTTLLLTVKKVTLCQSLQKERGVVES